MAFKILNPEDTNRAMQYEAWKNATMPMVTVGRTFDVTHIVKASKRSGRKLNMLMCHCIGLAAREIPEFYLLPRGDKFYQFDRLAVQAIVKNKEGGITFCSVPFSEKIDKFEADYLRLTEESASNCCHHFEDDAMTIFTSAVVGTELDFVCNQYTGYNEPFICWGKYRKRFWRRFQLPIFLQFNHKQMDGEHIAQFFNKLQKIMDKV